MALVDVGVLLVAVVFQVPLVTVLLQQVVGVAGGQPISTRCLRGHRWRLPLLPLPTSGDRGGQACRKEEHEEAQDNF